MDITNSISKCSCLSLEWCFLCVLLGFMLVDKQNKEIERITADVRDMQKTINTNTSALQRADAMTEELIYKVTMSCLIYISLFICVYY